MQDWWPAGWYALHVGKSKPEQVVQDALVQARIAEMPEESTLERGIVGAIKLARVAKSSEVEHQFCFPTFGSACYSIVAAKPFECAIQGASGKPGRWMITDPKVIAEFEKALADAPEETFPDILPDTAHAMGAKQSEKQKSNKRARIGYFQLPASQPHKPPKEVPAPRRTYAENQSGPAPSRSTGAAASEVLAPATQPEASEVFVPATQPEAAEVFVPPTQPEPPLSAGAGYRDEVFNFHFDNAKVADASKAIPDPLEPMIQRLRACNTTKALRKETVPLELFSGFQDGDATYETIRSWLDAILADDRTNRAIAEDTTFSIRLLAPIPFRLAVQTVALRQAWPTEGLLLSAQSNIGWMEMPDTRIWEVDGDEQARSPNIPFFIGLKASMRKTSLKDTHCKRTFVNSNGSLS